MKTLLALLIAISALLAYSMLDDVSNTEVSNRLDSVCKSLHLNPENFKMDGEKEINRGILITEHYFPFTSKKDSVRIKIVAYSGLQGGEIHHMAETLNGDRL